MPLYEDRQRRFNLRLLILIVIIVVSVYQYKNDRFRIPFGPANAADLNSEYVIKLPPAYAQNDSQRVTAYGTAECFAGPVKAMKRNIPTDATVTEVDLNASPDAGRRFMRMLQEAHQTRYTVPSYQVKDYLIFSNKNAAAQIRAALAESSAAN